MAQFVFHGRVLPVFMQFTMIGSLSVHLEVDIGDPQKLIMDASIGINKAIVEIICESNLFGTDNYDGHVELKAGDLADTVVNSYAFAKGTYLRAVLDSVTKPDGIKYNIRAYRPELEPLVTALKAGTDGGIDIKPILTTVLSNPTIFLALKDIVEAIPSHGALTNCARSIEGIRQSMAAGDRKAGWRMLRDNLNVSQKFVEFITDSSKGPRHGDAVDIPFSTIHESRRRSWIIMNRFLEFKKRGDKQLPLSEFPLLDD